jgi:hypothetical protein
VQKQKVLLGGPPRLEDRRWGGIDEDEGMRKRVRAPGIAREALDKAVAESALHKDFVCEDAMAARADVTDGGRG